MHRVETSFQALHERIEYLEQRQAGEGPTDEQVERILRKILSERFADANVGHVGGSSGRKDANAFLRKPDTSLSVPKAIPISITELEVNPEAMPSKAYGQSFQMLEKELSNFPRVDTTKSARKDNNTAEKLDTEFKRPRTPSHTTSTKPW